MIEHPGAAVMLPLDGDRIWLVRQPREVVGEESLLELPAGKLERGRGRSTRPSASCARRSASPPPTWQHLTSFYASPGFTNEEIHAFLATDSADDPLEAEEDERIEIVSEPLDRLDDVIRSCRDCEEPRDAALVPGVRALSAARKGHDVRRGAGRAGVGGARGRPRASRSGSRACGRWRRSAVRSTAGTHVHAALQPLCPEPRGGDRGGGPLDARAPLGRAAVRARTDGDVAAAARGGWDARSTSTSTTAFHWARSDGRWSASRSCAAGGARDMRRELQAFSEFAERRSSLIGNAGCASRSRRAREKPGWMADATAQAPSRFGELVLDFLAYLELERGMARNTLQSYRSDLLQFGAFLAERGPTRRGCAAAADVSDFLTELAQGNGRPGRQQRDDPAQGRRAALLLPAPAPRGRARLRPDGEALRAAPEPQAARACSAGPRCSGCSSSRRGPTRSRCATARCSS